MPICDQCGGKFEGVSTHDLMNDVAKLDLFLHKQKKVLERMQKFRAEIIRRDALMVDQIVLIIEAIEKRYKVKGEEPV